MVLLRPAEIVKPRKKKTRKNTIVEEKEQKPCKKKKRLPKEPSNVLKDFLKPIRVVLTAEVALQKPITSPCF